MLGYVATGHGRALDVAEAIAAYKRFYGVVDIFFDEAATDCTSLEALYSPWLAAVKANDGFVVVNPGVTPAPCWAAATDVIVNFEGAYSSYPTQSYPAWTQSYPPSKFWHIVYSVPVGSARSVLDLATQRMVGYLYTTADGLPNPYDTLSDEYSIVSSSNDPRPTGIGVPGADGAPIILVPDGAAAPSTTGYTGG